MALPSGHCGPGSRKISLARQLSPICKCVLILSRAFGVFKELLTQGVTTRTTLSHCSRSQTAARTEPHMVFGSYGSKLAVRNSVPGGALQSGGALPASCGTEVPQLMQGIIDVMWLYNYVASSLFGRPGSSASAKKCSWLKRNAAGRRHLFHQLDGVLCAAHCHCQFCVCLLVLASSMQSLGPKPS